MIAFWILAVLIVASALFVVMARQPVYSVVGLLVNFICLAIVYLTLTAEFLAVIQILVYSGAILMLFLFVIALLSSGTRPFSLGPNRLPRVMRPVTVFGIIALAGLLYVALQPSTQVAAPAAAGVVPGAADVFGSVADFGKALFTTWLLPFEATAFILMIAVIGVIALAGDVEPPQPKKAAGGSARERKPVLKES